MATRKTVLLTGSSGFIAKHIGLQLLEKGFHVRGTVRSMKRGQEVVDAIRPHLSVKDDLKERLSFVELDLRSDAGWVDAMKCIDVLMHTASPFPIEQPEDESELIRPAVDGTLRALRAAHAAGVKRVIFTSSTAAVMATDLPEGKAEFDEEIWSDVSSEIINPYAKSKTLAEKAAWDFVREEAPDMDLTTINPGFVLGAPLDTQFGTSLQVIQRIIRTSHPAMPNVGFDCVDIRDVARMHVEAIGNPKTFGRRHIGVAGFLWMPEMAKVIADAYPDRKIVTRRAPNELIRIIALREKSVRDIVPVLDVKKVASNARARAVFNMEFIPVKDAVRASAAYIIDNDLAG